MIRRIWVTLALCVPLPALATDKVPCASGNVCASKPDTVVKALQDAGYRAKLGKDKDGDPMIESAANGYNFDIYFFGCEGAKDCDSLEFTAGFTAEPRFTAKFINDWNRANRFGYAFLADDGDFTMRYDVSTMPGGLPDKNFADVIDWYQTKLADLRKFFDAKPVPPVVNK
jgi:Putative bacterial sensory transduction regulator